MFFDKESSRESDPKQNRIDRIEVSSFKHKAVINKIHRALFGEDAIPEEDYSNSYGFYKLTMVEKPKSLSEELISAKAEITKLKAIVAEVCDYVYRDEPETHPIQPSPAESP